MGTQPEEKNFIVVEAFDFDSTHMLISCREKSYSHRHYFYVRRPCWIDFGDNVTLDWENKKLILDRGPLLKYRFSIEAMPDEAIIHIVETNPFKDSLFFDFGE